MSIDTVDSSTILDHPVWTPVCPYERLERERGVAALIDGVQVAIFRTHDDALYAIGNRDPIAGAAVLSRGIVGSRRDAPTVASPLHKQVYDLRTGACLDVPGVRVPSYPVRARAGMVEICTAPDRSGGPAGGPGEPAAHALP